MQKIFEKLGPGYLKKDTPSGIVFTDDGRRQLYLFNQFMGEGLLPGRFSAWDYFYNLRFLQDFPAMTHWFFGDPWTQRIKISKPVRRGDELDGFVWFSDEEDVGPYRIIRAYDMYPMPQPINDMRPSPPWVEAPLPKLFNNPLNLPLRLTVAQAVTAALDDDWPYDQWQLVTSAIPAQDVPTVFPEDVGQFGFRLRGFDTNLRKALCTLQGIRPNSKEFHS